MGRSQEHADEPLCGRRRDGENEERATSRSASLRYGFRLLKEAHMVVDMRVLGGTLDFEGRTNTLPVESRLLARGTEYGEIEIGLKGPFPGYISSWLECYIRTTECSREAVHDYACDVTPLILIVLHCPHFQSLRVDVAFDTADYTPPCSFQIQSTPISTVRVPKQQLSPTSSSPQSLRNLTRFSRSQVSYSCGLVLESS